MQRVFDGGDGGGHTPPRERVKNLVKPPASHWGRLRAQELADGFLAESP